MTENMLSRYGGVPPQNALAQAWDRDLVLPFARRVGGNGSSSAPADWQSTGDVMRSLDARQGNSWQFGWPQMVTGAGDAANALAAASLFAPQPRPSQHPDLTESMIEHASSVVGPMAAAGMGRAAIAAPGSTELGMFGAPPHIQRLQEAGRIQSGARGSMEALAEAKAEWAKGNLDTWAKTGWESPEATGGVIKQPFAWHDTSDLHVRPEIAGPLEAMREAGARDYNNIDGALPDMVHGRGLDDLMIAEPRLKRSQAELGMVDRASGDFAADGSRVTAFGPSRQVIDEVLSHELGGHGPLVAGRAIDFGKSPARGTPIAGTSAELAQTDPARAARARELAGYFATIPEHLARVDMMTAANPRLLDNISPLRIDSYVPEALPGGGANMLQSWPGNTLQDFRPPFTMPGLQPHPGGVPMTRPPPLPRR